MRINFDFFFSLEKPIFHHKRIHYMVFTKSVKLHANIPIKWGEVRRKFVKGPPINSKLKIS